MSRWGYIIHVLWPGHRWERVWSIGYSCRSSEVGYLCRVCGKIKREYFG